jgi:hypothetical protein
MIAVLMSRIVLFVAGDIQKNQKLCINQKDGQEFVA